MKAKYRFVGKYLKNNAFLNDTKCTLAQVQPYNATFTVTLLSWPNNYSEYFFYLTWSAQVTFLPLISIRRLKASVLRLNFYLKTTGHFFQNSSFLYYHIWKKIQRHSYNNHKTIFQNFEIHGSYNMAWLMAIIVVWWKRM